MSKKKHPNPPQKISGPLPVLHGNVFVAFIDEARSIGNECTARREFDADVEEYLKQKSLLEEFVAWREAKRAPKT